MEKEIKLVGSNFLKLHCEKNHEFSGDITINSNISINKIEFFNNSKDTAKITYSFKIDYSDLGKIELQGNIFISCKEEIIKSLIESKDKPFQSEESIFLTNLIMKKASIKAFELEDEFGLPLHIRLPSLNVKKD